jgi:hypothetical protein
MMKKWFLVGVMLLLASSLAVGCGVPQEDYDAVVAERDAAQAEATSLQSELAGVQGELDDTKRDLSTTESNLATAESDLATANTRITSLESNLSTTRSDYQAVSNELAELKSFYDGIFKGEPPPYYKPDGELMHLLDNDSAQDPTWQQLVDFLVLDKTDSKKYVKDEYVCSGFAEDVHNNAEAAGIRCALVSLGFEDSDIGHALNAFNTTDRGLVFIDCTGVSETMDISWDRIAFLMIGERYGCLMLDNDIQSFEYDTYKNLFVNYEEKVSRFEKTWIRYREDIQSYYMAAESYNEQVREWISAVEAYNLNPTPAEYARLVAWQSSLLAEDSRLSVMYANLRATIFYLIQELVNLGLQYDEVGGVLGIVKEVKMYW